MTAPRAQEIEGAVDRNAVDPCAEVRTLLETVDLPVSAEEHLLHHVIGIMLISGHSIGHSEDGAAVTFHELAKRVGVATLGPADGCHVRRRLHSDRLDSEGRGWLAPLEQPRRRATAASVPQPNLLRCVTYK